jgi:hypothetical protein
MKKMNEEYFHVSDALGFDKGKSDLALEIAKLGLILRRTAKITKADPDLMDSLMFNTVASYMIGRGHPELVENISTLVDFTLLLNDYYIFYMQNRPEKES